VNLDVHLGISKRGSGGSRHFKRGLENGLVERGRKIVIIAFGLKKGGGGILTFSGWRQSTETENGNSNGRGAIRRGNFKREEYKAFTGKGMGV